MSRWLWKMCEEMVLALFTVRCSAVASVVNLMWLMWLAFRSLPGCQQLWRPMSCCDQFARKPGSSRLDVLHRLWAEPLALVAGILESLRALYTSWLIRWRWVERPVLLLRNSSWVLMRWLLRHMDKGVPRSVNARRRPTVTRIASSVRRIDRMLWMETHKSNSGCVRLEANKLTISISHVTPIKNTLNVADHPGKRPNSVADEHLCWRGMWYSWQCFMIGGPHKVKYQICEQLIWH